jgi:hypothetical protein
LVGLYDVNINPDAGRKRENLCQRYLDWQAISKLPNTSF